MPEEFEGDLAGSVFWGADMKGSTFRDVDLTGTRISHAWLVDVQIDALVDRLVVNGVDVTAYVNERDPWYPLRTMLTPTDPAGMRATWAALEAVWAPVIARVQAMPDEAAHRSVNGEFSFVETLRHLLMAMDKWFTQPVLGGTFHPYGLPNRGSIDVPFPGLDLSSTPSLSEVLAARAERADAFRAALDGLEPADLDRPIEVMENGSCQLRDGVFTVFEEEFWHHRYAVRDLAVTESGG